jgi:hypothetical protein
MKKLSFILIAMFSITLTSPEIRGRFLASVEEKGEKNVEQLEAIICQQKYELEHFQKTIQDLNVQVEQLRTFDYKEKLPRQMQVYTAPYIQQEVMQLGTPAQEQFSNYWGQNWEMLQLKMQLSYYQNQNYGGYGQASAPATASLDVNQFNSFRPISLNTAPYGQLSMNQPQIYQGYDLNLGLAPIDYSQSPQFYTPAQQGFNFN